MNQKNNFQNYSPVSYIPSPISSETSNQSFNSTQYIIYNHQPTANNLQKTTNTTTLLSPTTNNITFSYDNNTNNTNNNIIKNVNTQYNTSIPSTTTVTYINSSINSTSNYLLSPNESSNSVQYIQPV
eukprot:jgi/Orpsp1_1/1174234/evm.model.c7180000049368.1